MSGTLTREELAERLGALSTEFGKLALDVRTTDADLDFFTSAAETVEAAAAALREPVVEPGTSAGRITWHTSDPDGGSPDVGMSLTLPDGSELWAGEITRRRWEDAGEDAAELGSDGGWWLMHYPDAKSDPDVYGKLVNDEAGRELINVVAAALREPAVRFRWEEMTGDAWRCWVGRMIAGHICLWSSGVHRAYVSKSFPDWHQDGPSLAEAKAALEAHVLAQLGGTPAPDLTPLVRELVGEAAATAPEPAPRRTSISKAENDRWKAARDPNGPDRFGQDLIDEAGDEGAQPFGGGPLPGSAEMDPAAADFLRMLDPDMGIPISALRPMAEAPRDGTWVLARPRDWWVLPLHEVWHPPGVLVRYDADRDWWAAGATQLVYQTDDLAGWLPLPGAEPAPAWRRIEDGEPRTYEYVYAVVHRYERRWIEHGTWPSLRGRFGDHITHWQPLIVPPIPPEDDR